MDIVLKVSARKTSDHGRPGAWPPGDDSGYAKGM